MTGILCYCYDAIKFKPFIFLPLFTIPGELFCHDGNIGNQNIIKVYWRFAENSLN